MATRLWAIPVRFDMTLHLYLVSEGSRFQAVGHTRYFIVLMELAYESPRLPEDLFLDVNTIILFLWKFSVLLCALNSK